jgi:two-component system, OmpR family, sensor histidine kinase BaeS
VVGNLLTNALKFTPPGGAVRLVVGAADGVARLEVSDTGPGIPDDEQAHIFERFWRGTNAERHAGSGIGLAVVAELVDAHDGRVAVDSAPGQGSTFTVLLPSV